MGINEEHEWLAKQNTSKYKNEWIAVYHKKIVGHYPTLKGLQQILLKKKINTEKPLYVRIPDGYLTLKNIVGKKRIRTLLALF